jgi:hypothetical protein
LLVVVEVEDEPVLGVVAVVAASAPAGRLVRSTVVVVPSAVAEVMLLRVVVSLATGVVVASEAMVGVGVAAVAHSVA